MSVVSSTDQKYSSIISTAKELKAKKEAGVVSFSRMSDPITFKMDNLELDKNPDIAKNTGFDTTALSKKSKITYPKNEFMSDMLSSTAYGYSVNLAGFMGADFNKAAGLPENFKIHKSTLEEIANISQSSHLFNIFKAPHEQTKIYENIDMANTIKQYYNIFNQVVGKDLPNKEVYGIIDLSRLPTGFSSNGVKGISFKPLNAQAEKMMVDRSNEKVTNLYYLSDQVADNDANIKKLNFSPKSMSTDQNPSWLAFNPDMSPYQRDDGYTKEAIFMSFLKSAGHTVLDGGETRLEPEVFARTSQMARATAKLLEKIKMEASILQNEPENIKNYIKFLSENNALDINKSDKETISSIFSLPDGNKIFNGIA